MSILAFPLPLRLRRGGNPLLRLLFWGAKPSARSGEATRAEVNRKAEALLDAHGSSILRLAYAYLHNLADAEEVLQDTMVKYLQTAPELNGPEHEKAWLLRVTLHCCVDLRRSAWWKRTAPLEAAADAAAPLSEEKGEEKIMAIVEKNGGCVSRNALIRQMALPIGVCDDLIGVREGRGSEV